MSNTPRSLKLTRASLPVEIECEDGSKRTYKLVEMTAHERDKHLDETKSRLKMEGGEVVGITRFDKMEGELVSRCLRDENDKQVPIEEIQKWPSTVVHALYKDAQDLNHLNEKKKESEKNDSTASS